MKCFELKKNEDKNRNLLFKALKRKKIRTTTVIVKFSDTTYTIPTIATAAAAVKI